MRYWYNSVLNYLDGYTKEGKIGVVTTNYDKSKLTTYIELLKGKIEDAEKLKGTLIGAKKNIDLIRLKKELSFFENFLVQKFAYLDPYGNEEIWEFDLIISQHFVFEWKIPVDCLSRKAVKENTQ